ncbi:secreted protein [Rhodopirellula europaea SH398]|uniref:Secreted protein n=1 Tax=Rhodopirellula europaea SH398 TaxID=1263868 RepID=M5SN21_9BACT|nr:secreted protein [Rhodopirellula europaea SH398]
MRRFWANVFTCRLPATFAGMLSGAELAGFLGMNLSRESCS